MRDTSILPTLLLVLCFSAAAAAEPFHSPGGGWTAEIPAGWKPLPADSATPPPDRARFTGLEGPAVQLKIEGTRIDTPLALLAVQMKEDFAARKLVVENEATGAAGALPTWSYEYVQRTDTLAIRVVQAVADAGRYKVLVSVAGPEPISKAAHDTVARVLASLAVTPPDEKMPELEKRAFAAYGLKADLPKGGTVTETPAALEVSWEEANLTFGARWRRTALAPADLARYDISGFDPAEEQGYVVDSLKQEAVQIGGKPAQAASFYLCREGTHALTNTVVYRPAGPGEIVALSFVFLGERKLDDLLSFVQCLTAAEVAPHLAAPAGAAPALKAATEIWKGAAKAKLPEGWAAISERGPRAVAGGPQAEESKLWGAERAADLGVRCECGTIAGGAAAFETWLKEKAFRKREVAMPEPSRDVQVGGRAGKAWTVVNGPSSDRWVADVVAVFDGDRYYMVRANAPASLKAAYGGLAEAVGATVVWGGK